MYEKVCPNCGKRFPTPYSLQKFCSPNCRIYSWNYHHPSKRSKSPLYWQVLNRDNFRCQYCGRNPTQHAVVLRIDHIKPKMDGGKNHFDNLVTACEHCNVMKATRPLLHEAQFKKRLQRRTPPASSQTAFNFLLSSQNDETIA